MTDFLGVIGVMIDENAIAQVIGILCLIGSLLNLFNKNDDTMILRSAFVAAGFSLHYFLLSEWVLCATVAVITVRVLAAWRWPGSRWLSVFFIGLMLVQTAILYNDLWSILPMTAGIIGTLVYFFARGITLRLGFIISSSCMLAAAIHSGSVGGSLAETVGITIHAWVAFQLYRRTKQQKEEALTSPLNNI